MKLREHFAQAGFLIDVMSLISIISVYVLGFVLSIALSMEVTSHLFSHRGPDWSKLKDWHTLMGPAIIYFAVIPLSLVGLNVWKRRKSNRAQIKPSPLA